VLQIGKTLAMKQIHASDKVTHHLEVGMGVDESRQHDCLLEVSSLCASSNVPDV
jgi:hypothetical protein